MNLRLEENMPIYAQIMRSIKQAIASGELHQGEKIKPVRELAIEFGVNPNTMQRAMTELEREGVLFSERTAGRYVTKDMELISAIRRDMAYDATESYIAAMRALGYSEEEIKSFFSLTLGAVKNTNLMSG